MTDDAADDTDADAGGNASGTGTEAGAAVPDGWADELRAKRAEKDAFLREHPQSPLPPAEREGFDGLDYYPPDPAYRVRATARVRDEPEPVELETSAGPPVRYLHVATLSTPLPGAPDATLAALRQPDDEALFVPFADATSGETTYAEGRYLELHPDASDAPPEAALAGGAPADGRAANGDDATDAGVVVDFNLAYTPFCAFSETFSCPYPPERNRLAVAVEAGERVRDD